MRWIKCYYALVIIWGRLERTFGGCGSREDMYFPVMKSDAAPGEFPWEVSINHEENHVCSGTIISEFWVVSAAQCFTDRQNGLVMEVGVVNLKVKGRIYPLESTLLHKGYSKESSENNIALLESSEAIQFNDMVQPACFPEDHILRIDHLSNCWIATWRNQIQDSHMAVLLQKLPVNPVESCHFNNTKQIMCGIVGNVPEGSNCAVKSGDSLLCQHGEKKVWALTGIVSTSSTSCAQTIIIASMANYVSWVIENTAMEGKPVIPTLDVDVKSKRPSEEDVLTKYTFDIEDIPELTMKNKAENTAIILKEGTWDVVFPFCFLVVCIIFWM